MLTDIAAPVHPLPGSLGLASHWSGDPAELCPDQVDDVSGAILPLVAFGAGLCAGAALGVLGTYLYMKWRQH